MKHLKRFTCMAMAAAMALSLAACGGTPSDAGGSGSEAGSGDQKTIVVGTSNFTEVNILGEIYTELIEANTDYEVEQRFGLSGAAMCFDALEQGSIDMFVEYTGTALLNLLAQPMDTDKDRVWQTVHDLMLEEHGIQTSNPLGYNNTYVMSVKPETAEKYGLTSLSDLIEKSPELRLGCTVEFMDREDCLPLLESKYGTAFQDVKGLDASRHHLDGGIRHHAVKYRHLAPGQVPRHLIRHTDTRHKTVGHNHNFFVLHPAQAFQRALTKKDSGAEAEFLHVSPPFPALQGVCAAGISPPPAP